MVNSEGKWCKTKKRSLKKAGAILIVLAFIALLSAGSFFYRQIKPRLMLTSALEKALSDIETRFQEDPLLFLLDIYDPQGQYTADLHLDADSMFLGATVLDMTLSTHRAAGQFQGEGSIQTNTVPLAFRFYGDNSVLALSSQDFPEGQFYGIPFDTFSSDIKDIPLANLIISDRILETWNNVLQTIRPQTATPTVPLPDFTALSQILPRLTVLPCSIETVSIVSAAQPLVCQKLCYSIPQDQAALVRNSTAGGSGVFSFYLSGDTLVRITAEGEQGNKPFQYCLDLGTDLKTSPIAFLGTTENRSIQATVEPLDIQDCYAERWDIQTTENGIAQAHSFSFSWDPHTGDTALKSEAFSDALKLNLQKTEAGLRIAVQDLPVLRQWTRTEGEGEGSLEIHLSPGSEIQKPEYKSLSQWSAEDFLSVLGTVGSVLNISLS